MLLFVIKTKTISFEEELAKKLEKQTNKNKITEVILQDKKNVSRGK